MEKDSKQLVKLAYQAQKYSYTPYSNFNVGAALLSDNGKVYLGCNIENVAQTSTCCAERTALFKAVSEGVTDFKKIAIVGNKKDATPKEKNFCSPCGVCRQALAEFCDFDTFVVILAKSEDDFKEYTLGELLPIGFTNKDL